MGFSFVRISTVIWPTLHERVLLSKLTRSTRYVRIENFDRCVKRAVLRLVRFVLTQNEAGQSKELAEEVFGAFRKWEQIPKSASYLLSS